MANGGDGGQSLIEAVRSWPGWVQIGTTLGFLGSLATGVAAWLRASGRRIFPGRSSDASLASTLDHVASIVEDLREGQRAHGRELEGIRDSIRNVSHRTDSVAREAIRARREAEEAKRRAAAAEARAEEARWGKEQT